MNELPSLSILVLLEAYRSGSRTPTAVIRETLARIGAYHDPAVWISHVPSEGLLARACALESDPAARQLPLYGIPFAVKDNIDVSGLPTTAACPPFAYSPGANATVVQRLLDAGAMLIGKTNLDQFATGLVGTRSPHGAPRCVFDGDIISGGSSSGSAVAVAAGLVSFALGTDTAGSGRIPAGFNNIVGLKPTKGVVSTSGIVPACKSLDCVSIFAQTAPDALLVLEAVLAEDETDSYSRSSQPVELPQDRFRFGILKASDREFFGDPQVERLYETAILNMCEMGGIPAEIDYTPFREVASLLYDGPYVAERLAAIEPFLATRPDALDPVVRGIIAGARGFSAADAFRGEYRLRTLARRAAREWRGIDLMMLPTTPTIFTVAAVQADPIRLNSQLGHYTNFVNLLDYAAIAIPAGFRTDGLPAGVTLVGPAFSDHDLARLGARLHRKAACGTGLARDAAVPAGIPPGPAPEPMIELVVAGAHLSGMALNHQLLELGASLVAATRTAPDYRLLALTGTVPEKPGLVCTPGLMGVGIEVEVWQLREPAFARFVASLPPPMVIGKVRLNDGRLVPGFLCEPCAVDGAVDITSHGGWRAYVGSRHLTAG